MIKYTTLVCPGAGAGAWSRSRNFSIQAPAKAVEDSVLKLNKDRQCVKAEKRHGVSQAKRRQCAKAEQGQEVSPSWKRTDSVLKLNKDCESAPNFRDKP